MRKTRLVILLLLALQIVGFPLVGKTIADSDFSGFVYGVGTYFEITNSPYLNTTLNSGENIRLLLQSGPGMVSFIIEANSSATSTVLNIGGLEPNKTFYRLQDGDLIDNSPTDPDGKYVFTQDVSQPHHVIIQEWEATITIKSDGTVSPPTAPISVVGNVYTFTANIYERIYIQKDGIVLDGDGYTLQGPNSDYGIYMSGRSNVEIRNIVAKRWFHALNAWYCNNLHIEGNEFSDNKDCGILFYDCDSNNITENLVERNNKGIGLAWYSANNIVTGNSISDQTFRGLYMMYQVDDNHFYHNNFANWYQVQLLLYCSGNVWDNGYPSGGNYWSDYSGADSFGGPNQNVPSSDGIGDNPYSIASGNQDMYPLMNPWTPAASEETVEITRGQETYVVGLVSTATISDVGVTRNSFHFDISGAAGTSAYVSFVSPIGLNTTALKVFLNGQWLQPPPYPVITETITHYYGYFIVTFTSTVEVAVNFAPIPATIDLDPNALNLKSNGEFITAYIELPEGSDVADIVLETVYVEDMQAITDLGYGFVTDPSSYLMDHDNDGILERMVKLNRTSLITYLNAIDLNAEDITYLHGYAEVALTITGSLLDGTKFEGVDTITIIKPGRR